MNFSLPRFYNGLIVHRLKLLSVAVFLLCLMIIFTKPPKIDGSMSEFDLKDDPLWKNQQKIEKLFGHAAGIQLHIIPESTPTREVIVGLQSLSYALQSHFKTDSLGILSLHTILDASPLVVWNPYDPIYTTLEKVRKLPFMSKMVGKEVSSFLYDFTPPGSVNVDEFDALIGKKYNGIKSIHAISSFHIQDSVTNAITQDLIWLTILILAMSVGVLWLVFRNFSALFMLVAVLGSGLIPGLFFISFFNNQINLITVLVFPIVLVLSLSDGIHLLTGYRSCLREMDDAMEAVKITFERYFIPSFLTSATTAIAFFSFYFNATDAIWQFGRITAISTLVSFAFTYMLVPALLPWTMKNIKQHSKHHFFAGLTKTLFRRARGVSVLLILAGIGGMFLIGQLSFRSHANDFFPHGDAFYKNHQQFNRQFGSQLTVEILIETHGTFNFPAGVKLPVNDLPLVVADIVDELEHLPMVVRIGSIKEGIDYIKKHQLPPSMWTFIETGNPYRSSGGEAYKIEVRLDDADSAKPFYNGALPILKKYNDRCRYSFAGLVLLYDSINEQVARSLIKSLSFSALVILLLFYFLTHSWRFTALALYVNTLPLLTLILFYVWGSIDLNVVTAMTAVVCLGLVVDDSIHVLFRLVRSKAPLLELGNGMMTTSIILSIGFV